MSCTKDHTWVEQEGRGHTYVVCAVCHQFPPRHLASLREIEALKAALHGMLEHCGCQGRGYRSWHDGKIVKPCSSLSCGAARAALGLPPPPPGRPIFADPVEKGENE